MQPLEVFGKDEKGEVSDNGDGATGVGARVDFRDGRAEKSQWWKILILAQSGVEARAAAAAAAAAAATATWCCRPKPVATSAVTGGTAGGDGSGG